MIYALQLSSKVVLCSNKYVDMSNKIYAKFILEALMHLKLYTISSYIATNCKTFYMSYIYINCLKL